MISFDAKALSNGLSDDGQVSRGLNLVLELKSRATMPVLLTELLLKGEATRKALRELHFVHFARFLPLRDMSALLVITEFDGPLDPYALDFVIAIGDVFDAILKHVKDHPPLPVRENPREFMDFVRKNNKVYVAPLIPYPGEYPLYSAYPDKTVLDIIGPRTQLPPPAAQPKPVAITRANVQGNIINGYNASLARHFALRIDDAAIARDFLKVLVDGDESDCPVVTRATIWTERPLYFLNVGVTAEGLKQLGVPKALRDKFPRAFLEGPADRGRSESNGDIGDSAPMHWELGGLSEPVHLLVSLYADEDNPSSLEEFHLRSGMLTGWWKRTNGITIVAEHNARALPGKQVHFGYREGMAQPRIAGVPHDVGGDMQPHASAGEFLLGKDYISPYGGRSIGSLPRELCQDATFAAVRLLEQDVEAFERVLDQAQRQTGQDREWIAAKLMGRWRNGTPLSTAPFAPQGAVEPKRVPDADYNEFDYAPSREYPNVPNDHRGLVCPVGAHIRRMNPRSALVAGVPYSHRLIRRGMPYGSAWGTGLPTDKRGLYGMFLCADLERQFEFLLQEWANGDTAASGITGTQDPIIGAQNRSSEFDIPVEGRSAPIRVKLPRLVITRGSLYLLLPGIDGLRFLAKGEGFVANAAVPAKAATTGLLRYSPTQKLKFHPAVFNPKDENFLANPYPYYTEFRQHAPVSKVKHGSYESYWVFSHELVTQACDDTATYLKEMPGETGDRGLFFMDPPRHTQVRALLNPMFDKAIQDAADATREQASAALAAIRKKGPGFDLITQYSNRVTRNVFMQMFGLPEKEWASVGDTVNTILLHYDQMLPAWKRLPAALANAALGTYFNNAQSRCPAYGDTREFLCQMAQAARGGQLKEAEVTATATHFALGGYLSTDFLVGTSIHNLLSRPKALAAFRAADAQGKLRAIEELKRFDSPFQMADRFAALDTTLGGVEIPAGARVTLVYGAANRDERVFGPSADELDIARDIPAGTNFVFGHGIHHCIGEPMVEKVAPVAIELMLAALPTLPAGGYSERYEDPYFRAFSRLQMRL